jgi:phosphogluconate dehydratase
VRPLRVFQSQEDLQKAFAAGELTGDMVAVVRFQGPKANGMPELHKPMPPLGALQDRGLKIALVTDGRLSGASADPPNSRSARHITLRCSDLTLRLRRERDRVEQAMIAWQQRAGPSERSQGRKPAEPVARSASLDGAPLVRQRPPMRSWPDILPSARNKTLRCERWRSER